MRFHALPPNMKCPRCGAGLTFVRVRTFGDLYQCASGAPCRGQIMHYQRKERKICGYAAITSYGSFGEWNAYDMPAAKGK
jgi:hypothetical protein